MLLRSVSRLCFIGLSVFTCAYAGQTFRPMSGAYGPSEDVAVSRPCLRLEIWAPDGRDVAVSEMRVDGQVVGAKYDAKQRALLFPYQESLAAGEHAVECRVGFTGTPVYKAGWKFRVLPNAVESFPIATKEQLRTLEVVNGYRRRVGLPDMETNPVLDMAALGHSDYCAKNNVMGHVQRPGQPGFTGQTSQQRLGRLGWIGASYEGMTHGEATLEEAVASLFDSPYHRLPFIQPGQLSLGSGRCGNMTTINVSHCNDTATVVSPGENQTDVPYSWGRSESPNPLRMHPGASLPVGYPIVVALFGPERKIATIEATLKANGKDVPFFLNQPGNDNEITSEAFIIPKDPLLPKTAYDVTFKAMDEAGKIVEKNWRFTTASKK